MRTEILALALVTPEAFGQMLRRLRARYPEARVVALGGRPGQPEGGGSQAADEYLTWHSLGARPLIREVRRRRFDLVVVAHGRDYYASRVYWKAVALALMSGARGKLFCEDGRLGDETAPLARLTTGWAGGEAVARAVLRGLVKAAARGAAEVYVAAMGVLVAAVLIGMAVTDLTEAAVDAFRGTGRRVGQAR
jgi:hypothetical protein